MAAVVARKPIIAAGNALLIGITVRRVVQTERSFDVGCPSVAVGRVVVLVVDGVLGIRLRMIQLLVPGAGSF